MSREFLEECGISVPWSKWNHFVTLEGPDYQVFFFQVTAEAGGIEAAESLTEEKVKIVIVDDLWKEFVIPNLRWLIPLAWDCTRILRNPITVTDRE